MTGIFDYQTGRFVNRNGIGIVRICPDDLTRRGAGRGQYYYEVDESASKYFRFLKIPENVPKKSPKTSESLKSY